ncbi:MAG: radical SAM protein [Candidatus Bathyarchaeia archaeon]
MLTLIPEANIIKKDWRRVDLKIGLCYPNVYRAGMSGLTIRLLYALFNIRDDVLCERFFVPTRQEPWISLESGQPLRKFDVVAFTLQYEEDYVNVIRMLLRSNIPIRRENRKVGDPIVMMGGPCATANPEPLADFVDLFFIGEIEPVLDEIVNQLIDCKSSGRNIAAFADINGIYVPEKSNNAKRATVQNLDEAFHPVAQQVPMVEENSPYMTVFGRALAVEETRGCSRSCRFCLLRHISFPRRERSLLKIENIIDEGVKKAPVNKVSLIGASVFDHSRLEDICEYIVSQGYELSIPSLRPENITEKLAKLLVKGKQRSVTMAPDGASPRMREIICKQMNDETLVDAAKILLKHGLKHLKLYFMVGLPKETHNDIKAIVELSKKIADTGYSEKAIHLSINPLVPKPHTPFQWEKMASIQDIRESLNLLKKLFKGDRRFVVEGLDPRHAQIQALLSLGDRKIGKIVELSALYGGSLGAWRRAMKETGITFSKYIQGKNFDDPLPWDNIDVGISKKLLINEAKKFKNIV